MINNSYTTNTTITDRKSHYGNRILAENVMVSNDPYNMLNSNTVVIGGSGSGKTTSYVIPNIQCATGSLVIADTKSRLAREFGDSLVERGYQVYILDLVRPERSTFAYNPFQYIRRHSDGTVYEQDIMSIANMLYQRGSDTEPFWDNSAINYIAFLIAYMLLELPEEEHSLYSLAELHHIFLKPNSAKTFNMWASQCSNAFAKHKYEEINSVRPADKTFSCIMAFASTSLERYSFREGIHIFENSGNFDLHQLGRFKSAVFINISDTDFTYSSIASLFYHQVINLLCHDADDYSEGRLNVPCHIIMDDFCSSSAGLPNFDKIISVTRSRDISISVCLQSVSQLFCLYGHDAAQVILDNCDTMLYLGGQSMETAQYLAIRAGKLPENILRLPFDKMYLFVRGQKAEIHNKIKPGKEGDMVSQAMDGIDQMINAAGSETKEPDGFEDEFNYDDDLPFC